MFEKGDQVTVVSDNGYEGYSPYIGEEGVVRQVAEDLCVGGTVYPAAAAVVFPDGQEVAFSQDQLEKQS